MLKVILNRNVKPPAEEIIAEEQARFRAGGSTTKQIFNLRIVFEKYLVFTEDSDGRVWLETLWGTMRKYNISAN